MSRKRWVLAAGAAALGACQMVQFSTGVRTFVYNCPGKQMIVSFDDNTATASVSLPGEPLHVLPQRVAPEGAFLYADDTNMLAGERFEARWTGARAEPMVCYVRHAP